MGAAGQATGTGGGRECDGRADGLKGLSAIELQSLLCRFDHSRLRLLEGIWLFLTRKTIRARVEAMSAKWKISGGPHAR